MSNKINSRPGGARSEGVHRPARRATVSDPLTAPLRCEASMTVP